MVDPLGQSHHTPEWGEEKESSEASNQLFKRVSDLYFFCMAKDIVAQPDRAVFTTLSKIMQISKHSATHGGYLDQTIENKAAELIADLKESLQSGKIPRNSIPTKLEDILHLLTDDSRKARLVVLLTELEMKYFLGSTTPSSDSQQKKFQEIVSKIIEDISKSTPDINAEAIYRDLRHFMTEKHAPEEVLKELALCYDRWLR